MGPPNLPKSLRSLISQLISNNKHLKITFAKTKYLLQERMSQLRRDSSELSVALGRVYDIRYIARDKQFLNI
jgi:hypothetical protein